MRWPTRVLSLPRAALRALHGFVRRPVAEPTPSPDPLEFDLSSAAEPVDEDAVPTPKLHDSERPTKPARPSSMPPARRRGR